MSEVNLYEKILSSSYNATTEVNIYKKIISESYDAIMVTDSNGVIILANQATADSLHLTLSEVIGKTPQDMIEAGIYKNSTILEALSTKQVVTGIIKTHDRYRLSTSVPLFDQNGDIQIILTNSRSDDVLQEFSRQIAYEQEQHALYREIADYLSSLKEEELVYKSAAMEDIVDRCVFLAGADSTIMITGESGVGKELIAKFIHNVSARRNQAFIPVNCSAIPPELFESEFFGYSPGSFTGASAKGKLGLIQMAHKGTLFLDELGDLPMPMQSKLLRFAESGEFYSVGSTTPERVDVRIVSATNCDLLNMVHEKSFREDLYYRLNVIPINIPPLRERPEDVNVLAIFFLNRFNKKFNKRLTFSDRDLEMLRRYDWPGNVRELRNTVERTVLLSTQEGIKRNICIALGLDKKTPAPPCAASSEAAPLLNLDLTLQEALSQFETSYIERVLHNHQGRLADAAKSLGIHRTTLYRKQKRPRDPSCGVTDRV